MINRYYDRFEAGEILANDLKKLTNLDDCIVLALPRGGVPIGFEVAKELNLPLDVFVVRKLGVPGHAELAMGAIASGDITYLNNQLIKDLNIPEEAIKEVKQAEFQELQRREETYRGKTPFPNLKNKTVILVDDGVATGATTKAAIKAIKVKKPKAIILAVPVGAKSTLEEISPEVSQIVCPLSPYNFGAVGLWYENFPQTKDEEVQHLLDLARQNRH